LIFSGIATKDESKMKVGLIGSGFMGKMHADVYKSLKNVELVALLDLETDKVNRFCSEYKIKFYSDSNLFFNDSSIDAVDICLPTFLHEEMIIKALNNGKHVLCEKPLSLSTESGERIKEAVSKSGKKFMVAQVMRFWPQYKKIKQLIEEKAIGEVEKVHTYRLSEPPQWGDWFLSPEKGGGALYDLHIHDMDFIYSVFGKPESLIAKGVKGIKGTWDSIVSLLDYGNKSIIIEGDFRYPKGFPFRFGLLVRGNKGALEYTFQVDGNVDSVGSSLEKLIHYKDGIYEEIKLEKGKDAYFSEIDYFCKQIMSNQPIEIATIEEAVEVLDIIKHESVSMESGKEEPVKFTV
jgi:predicted dehydrogenase